MMTKPSTDADAPLVAGSDLGRLYDLAASDAPLFRGEDLATVLAAQLDLPAPRGTGGATRTGATWRDLLRDGAAAASTFVRLKTMAKAWHEGDEAQLADLAQAVYLATIAAALVHHDALITRLQPSALDRRLAWLLAQQWVDPDLRALARRARRRLKTAAPERSAGDR